jgi:hypothetical protein
LAMSTCLPDKLTKMPHPRTRDADEEEDGAVAAVSMETINTTHSKAKVRDGVGVATWGRLEEVEGGDTNNHTGHPITSNRP